MAKKRAKKVDATEEKRSTKAVRLDLTAEDHERLERAAKFQGLTKSSYARMAVLERIRTDEARTK